MIVSTTRQNYLSHWSNRAWKTRKRSTQGKGGLRSQIVSSICTSIVLLKSTTGRIPHVCPPPSNQYLSGTTNERNKKSFSLLDDYSKWSVVFVWWCNCHGLNYWEIFFVCFLGFLYFDPKKRKKLTMIPWIFIVIHTVWFRASPALAGCR